MRLTRSVCDSPTGKFSVENLLVAVDDTSAFQVVRGQFHDDAVLGEDADVVLAHLATDVGENLMPVVKLDTEHRVLQGLDDATLDLDCAFFSHTLRFPDTYFAAYLPDECHAKQQVSNVFESIACSALGFSRTHHQTTLSVYLRESKILPRSLLSIREDSIKWLKSLSLKLGFKRRGPGRRSAAS